MANFNSNYDLDLVRRERLAEIDAQVAEGVPAA